MPDSDTRFGTDLRLLLDLEHVKSSRDPGHDLAVRRRPETGLVDLDTWSSVDNLVQALFLRFLTPAGELAILGHPDYGSRLHELIGELNTETNRNRAKLYVLQALAAEPRVQKVLSVKVTQSKRDRAQMDIDVSLLAINSDTPLNLVFPFFLEGGVSA
ncbi:MAG: GPW/gp25 family protein [Chromatiales bacterium]